ncbi:hypothetical protein PVIIG_06323 [Plasmodium vivax India VII]|uniref:Uncharacterized protein n=1 Tax=Plasmodium vivax India VII TaxID=1077284 RepID=A0A0J9S1Y0_PLAVI|nr:hypothetical protein PVIIG_06323 [Plasmodium vivax India VII]
MTKHATIENYLNYEDYNHYYTKFNPDYRLSPLDEGKLTRLINETTYEQKVYEQYDEDLFNIFREFVRKYNLDSSIISDTCVNDMVFTNSNIFKEMDALYRTYDDYNKFLSNNRYKNEKTCGQLKDFVYVYNVYVKSNKSSSLYFNDILKNFEKNVKKTLQNFDSKCGSNNYSLSKLQLYTEPEKKPPKLEAAEVLPKPSPLTSSPQKGLEPERPNHIDTSENQEELPLSPPRENQVTHEDPINELHTETGPENETRHDIPIERRTQSQSQYAQPLEQRYLETFDIM